MDQGPDQDVISFLSVKDVVRLKAEATIARNKLVAIDSDTWEISQQSKSAVETRMVGVRLVSAKPGIREHIDIEQIGACSER
jgi:hypothetical protein